jgi:hypothetical protein
MSFATGLAALFDRDLARLIQQIEAFPDDDTLWQTLSGITNSTGNLALHLEGNLMEYIGRQLGKRAYNRERALEFRLKGMGRKELAAKLVELKQTIPSIIRTLSLEELEKEYAEVVLQRALSTQDFLIHLYGHLNWHLGQIDYLRRALTGDGAVKGVGL